MSAPHIVTLFGTRPECTKMAPVVRALEASSLRHSLVVSGQHREMLDQALEDLDLKPDHDLDLMKKGQTAGELVARVLTSCETLFREIQPDMVLVHGDTGTTAAGALAAFYCGVSLGHVEAGLRSGSLKAPFPEEGNRRIVDTVAQILWAPTERAAENLRAEGLGDRRITVTGNTAIDVVLQTVEKARGVDIPELDPQVLEHPYLLVTAHRREAFGEPFRQICRALRKIADCYPEMHVVYPVHLNPNVQGPVHEILGEHPRIHLIEPLSYLPFLHLLDGSHLVLTDSGGLQEEAPALGKPVLVMRERTERQEAVEAGTVRLVGTQEESIFQGVETLLDSKDEYQAMVQAENPFGDGTAAEKIVADLESWFA